MAVTEDSILEGVLTLEPQFTRLLANFLNLDEGFRGQFLKLCGLVGSCDNLQFKYEKDLGSAGRPDLEISNDDVLLFLEVKIRSKCRLTGPQRRFAKKGYKVSVKSDKRKNKLVRYLLPSDYHFRQSDNIEPSDILWWSQVIFLINARESNAHRLFRSILERRFKPVALSIDDVNVLPQSGSNLLILTKLLTETRNLAFTDHEFAFEVRKAYWLADECGFKVEGRYFVGFYNQFLDSDGNNPICFGIERPSAGESRALLELLRAKQPLDATPRPIEGGLYIGIPNEVIAGKSDSAQALWNYIKVFFKALAEANSTPQS